MNQQFVFDSNGAISAGIVASPHATPWLYTARPLTVMAFTAVLPSLDGTNTFIDRVRALQNRRTSEQRTILELSSNGDYLVRPREACFLLGIGRNYELLKLMCDAYGVSRIVIGGRVYYPLAGLAVVFHEACFDRRG